MLEFATPYLDMYKADGLRFRKKPKVLHRQTCPRCNKNNVNLYYQERMHEYVCNKCSIKIKEK